VWSRRDKRLSCRCVGAFGCFTFYDTSSVICFNMGHTVHICRDVNTYMSVIIGYSGSVVVDTLTSFTDVSPWFTSDTRIS
jgi:hypothetical protein